MAEKELLQYIMKDLAEVKRDVKKLIGFRAMLVGGCIAVSAITSVAIAILFGR